MVASVNGPASAKAWVELVPEMVLGEDPSRLYAVRFHAKAENAPEIVITDVILEYGQVDLIKWISDTSVLFADAFIADTANGTYKRLKVPVPGGKIDPSNSMIAYWTSMPSGEKGAVILDLGTGETKLVASFSFSDWGTEEPEFGVAPSLSWLDASTLLFDMPSDKRPAIGVFYLESGNTALFRPHAWGAQASGDGRYVCYVSRSDWGHTDESRLVIEDLTTGKTSYVAVNGSPFDARVRWPSQGSMIVASGSAIGLYKLTGETWILQRDEKAAGDIVALQSVPGGVEYTDLVRDRSGAPAGCAIRRFPSDLK